MSTRPPVHVTSPRAAAHQQSPHGNAYSPSTIPVRPMSASASPKSSRPSATAAESPFRPKRPLSAPRVHTTTGRPRTPPVILLTPPSSASARTKSPPCRPASASRVRATYTASTLCRRVDDESEQDDVDTIAIPVKRIQVDPPTDEASTVAVHKPTPDDLPPSEPQPPPGNTIELDRAAVDEAEKFLRAWQYEEASFRSPLLFAEATFAQAKAMTSHVWPHPNVFLSSIAFGSLELFCKSHERQHPFLVELTDTLGTALFANHRDLRRAQLHPMGHTDATSTSTRFLQYLQHGQYCFQQLHAQEDQLALWRRAAQAAKRENQRLSEQLHKQHVARLFDRVQARVQTAAATKSTIATPNQQSYPQLRHMLFGGPQGACLDLQDEDYEFEPTAVEILLVFNSLRPDEATKLLKMMHAKACEMQLPQLAEMYAVAVDMLPEKERRKFLDEYFQLVESGELQDALRVRDETNLDKEWESFLDEMKDALRIYDAPGRKSDPVAPQFHSDQARVGAGVYDIVDLVEDLAAEISLADDRRPFRLSPELTARLKPYQSLKKRTDKAKQLMMTTPYDVPLVTASVTCGCVCGKHRLVTLDDPDATTTGLNNLEALGEDPVNDDPARKKKNSRKRSSVVGKSGAKRKSSGYAISARVSTRNSMATVRLFPLSEVCHLVSSVVQLQFAKESGDGISSRRASSARRNYDLSAILRPSFRRLAKELLTRKYGIKSIAVMHMLQLEKSLVHFGVTNKHVRCELFAWFIGADKTRSHYKDLAFQFYLRTVKTTIAVLLKKSPTDIAVMSYADLVAGWTELIGDADPATGVVPPKTLPSTQCIDVCQSVFPLWVKASPSFTALIDRLKVTFDTIELEQFVKRVLAAWEVQLVKVYAQIQETFARQVDAEAGELDLALFCKCANACGLELTSGQLLEHYDGLLGDEDFGVSMNKAILFVIEQKQ